MEAEFFFRNYSEQKASKIIYHKFGVNGKELTFLTCVVSYLQIYNKKAVSFHVLSDWIGYGPKVKYKSKGYLQGLWNKGLLHQLSYKCQPGSGNSMALAPYGARVLEAYYNEYLAVSAIQKQRMYKDNVINSNTMRESVPRYSLVKSGLD